MTSPQFEEWYDKNKNNKDWNSKFRAGQKKKYPQRQRQRQLEELISAELHSLKLNEQINAIKEE